MKTGRPKCEAGVPTTQPWRSGRCDVSRVYKHRSLRWSVDKDTYIPRLRTRCRWIFSHILRLALSPAVYRIGWKGRSLLSDRDKNTGPSRSQTLVIHCVDSHCPRRTVQRHLTFGLRYRANCSLCVQTGSGAHPASCTVATGVISPGVKRGRDVTLTTHPIYCRRWEWVGAIPPLPPSASMACSGTALPLQS
jgi:hypothetical protein